MLFPTLAALLGFEVAQHPSNYDYIRYRVQFTPAHLEEAANDPRAFWIHPVPRRYDEPVRRYLRDKWNQYQPPEACRMRAAPRTDMLLLTKPVFERMRSIEGWLEEDEADLLLAAASESLRNHKFTKGRPHCRSFFPISLPPAFTTLSSRL